MATKNAANFDNPIAIAEGGTGQAAKADGFDALSPLTTVGDVIIHDGANNVRLANSTTGKVLTANSGAIPSWETPAAGGDLGDLGDVTITGVADGEVLTYDSGSGDWVNEAGGGGGGGAALIPGYSSAIQTAGGLFTINTVYYQAITTMSALSANYMYLFPLAVGNELDVDELGILISTAQASAKARFGLYENTSGMPADLLFDSGELDCSSIGMKLSTYGTTISAGFYWFGLVSNNGSLAYKAVGNGRTTFCTDSTGNTPYDSFATSHTFGALPDPYSGTPILTNKGHPILYFNG